MKKRILVVEDDKDIALMIKDYLTKEHYDVLISHSGEEGILILKNNEVNFLILDVMLPGINGFEVLNKIRVFSEVPTMILTAKGEQMDKVIGFKGGCDDYLIKPFDLIELNLRIEAILRRRFKAEKAEENIIKYKDLIINKSEYLLKKGSEDIRLTKKEFEILLLFISNQGRIYTAETIYNLIWNEEYFEGDKSVTTHIRNLREKLGDKIKESNYIKTLWGVGYKIEKEY